MAGLAITRHALPLVTLHSAQSRHYFFVNFMSLFYLINKRFRANMNTPKGK